MCSGLKANKEKSEALGIGSCSNFKHKATGINWPDRSIKCLGVLINNDLETIYNENFNERLEKITKLMHQWCLCKLTLKGKTLVVNTLLMPQLLYLCTVLGTPN
jgi:sensor histidine kinase regulating citrate/malate metabolism